MILALIPMHLAELMLSTRNGSTGVTFLIEKLKQNVFTLKTVAASTNTVTDSGRIAKCAVSRDLVVEMVC